MRTNQQLGYIVWSFNQRVEERLFFKLVIQSATFSPFELKRRVEKWMRESEKLFSDLTDEKFEKFREALIVSLEKKGDSIAEEAGNLFYYATEEDGDFGFKDDMVAVAKKITKEEVIQAGRDIFLNSTTPRIVVLTRAKNNNEPVPDGTLTSVDQFKSRNNKHAVVKGSGGL